MPESYVTPFIATTNAIIASSDCNAGYAGNIRYYRQFLTNPDSANQWLQSTSADGADWVDRATAVLAAIGYTPANAAGQTFSGSVLVQTSNASAMALEAWNSGASPGNGFGVINAAASGYDFSVSHSGAVFTVPVTISGGTVWHSGNDGAGSGLDADLLDAQSSAYYLSRANHTGTQLAATISDLATAVSGLAAATAAVAANATDSDALDGFTWKQGKTGEFSGTQALTTSFADVSGASFTADRDGQWLVFARSENVMAIGDSHPSIEIVSGGVSQEEGVGNAASGTTMLAEATTFAFVTISGSTTVKVRVKKNANAATSNCLYAKIGGIWVAP